jgi:hypothetical protein
MNIQGKLISITTPQNYTGKNGKDYIKATLVVETEGQYPKKIAIDLGKAELIDKASQMSIGATISVDVNIESREYNGKWFTNINAFNLK